MHWNRLILVARLHSYHVHVRACSSQRPLATQLTARRMNCSHHFRDEELDRYLPVTCQLRTIWKSRLLPW